MPVWAQSTVTVKLECGSIAQPSHEGAQAVCGIRAHSRVTHVRVTGRYALSGLGYGSHVHSARHPSRPKGPRAAVRARRDFPRAARTARPRSLRVAASESQPDRRAAARTRAPRPIERRDSDNPDSDTRARLGQQRLGQPRLGQPTHWGPPRSRPGPGPGPAAESTSARDSLCLYHDRGPLSRTALFTPSGPPIMRVAPRAESGPSIRHGSMCTHPRPRP